MEIMRVVGFALTGVALLGVIRRTRGDLAMPLSVVMAIGIFLSVSDKLAAVFALLEDLVSSIQSAGPYFATTAKVIGIAYVAEFGSQLCRDADEGALATKVEFAGKVFVLLLTIPVVQTTLRTVLNIIGRG